jgi:uncharacterized membrane protein YhiD involved in acid resistance
MIGISTLQFAIRLLLAIAMGATVGLERQWRQRMAGTRTNALVAAGAAAFVMCGLLLDNDPSARGRIVSYVVSGVGFLGAGVIFKDGASVRGLNTAATIWCSAAIGALTGLGSFHLALVLAFAVLFTNMILRPLAYRLHPESWNTEGAFDDPRAVNCTRCRLFGQVTTNVGGSIVTTVRREWERRGSSTYAKPFLIYKAVLVYTRSYDRNNF